MAEGLFLTPSHRMFLTHISGAQTQKYTNSYCVTCKASQPFKIINYIDQVR
jgi:hypothetical protein